MQLPEEVEHIYPDYSIYYGLIPDIKNTAYGFMSRGCPRGCDFCHVKDKEGKRTYKVADLSEFWRGQQNIVLLDPNPTACKQWKENFQQLIDSGAYVDFSQGVDIRTMTAEKAEMIKQMKVNQIHFAWDRYQDKDIVLPKLKMFQQITGWKDWKMTVYVLVNFDTTTEQDLERIYTLRDLGYTPFVMVYDREHTKSSDTVRRIQRWVDSKVKMYKTTCRDFKDYKG